MMASRTTADYPGAARWVPAERSIERLRAAAVACQGCDLYRDATQVVMGDGDPHASVMLVGEQPGDREDRQGEPFVGPAGRLLDQALAQAGIERSSTFTTNAVKHFRFKTTGKQRIHVTPSRWQVASCQPWLLAELDAVAPRVVVLLGATAGQAVYGTDFRVTAARGRPLEPPTFLDGLDAPTFVATVHPSSVLRSRQRDTDLDAFVRDLTVAAAALAQ